MSTITLDVVLKCISYIPILHAIFYLPSQDAYHKALNPVGPMSVSSYSFMVLRSSQPPETATDSHVLLASACILAPPGLTPIIYGVKTKQIRDQMTHDLLYSQPSSHI